MHFMIKTEIRHTYANYCCFNLASYPDLLAPAFVACSTNVGEGLVKLSHVQ